jgi:basic membrane lipoprotein Med (substrate-binding protein (PBP1-ABC) superfamily)
METGLLRHMQSKFYHYYGNPGVTQSTQALSKQRKIGNHGNEMWFSHSLSHTTPTHQVMSSRRKSGDNKCFKEQAQRHVPKNNFVTLTDGTDRLSRNVGKELPPYAA